MNEKIRIIRSNEITVQVNLRGAELWSIKDSEGTEYLWQGDAKYWGDKAPVLFPYIARLTCGKYILDGREYSMDIHGFAKNSMFDVIEQSDSLLVLKIEDSKETYSQFPYKFIFEITYKLDGNRLSVCFHIENKDTKTMYFGVGGHPGFNVPLYPSQQFEDYYLEFCGAEQPLKVLFSEDCFVLGQTENFPLIAGNKLPLRHDLFDDDAIILTNIPKQVILKSQTGGKSVVVSYPQMDYLGLWHCPRTDAPYICIEPWSSLPSRKNVIEDLAKQDNLLRVSGGETVERSWSVEITY